MNVNRWLMAAAVSAALSMGLTQGLAQNDQGGGPGGPGGAGGPGGPGGPGGRRGNFDPAQFQQRMMERAKEALEVTDDAEWKAMEPLIQKVMTARMAAMGGMGRGMFGPPRRPGGDAGGGGDQAARRGPMGEPSAEADALQKAIDAKAPKAEIKATLAKFLEARKAKQAELETAQDNLRKVLTSRQEAIATLYGWL